MKTLLTELSVSWAPFAGYTILLKASVMLALAGTVTTVARRASAASRHSVWSLALLALLVLPLLSVSLPNWKLQGVTAEMTALGPAADAQATIEETWANSVRPKGRGIADGYVRHAQPLRTVDNADSDAPAGHALPLGSVVAGVAMLVWAFGAAFLLGRFTLAAVRVRAISRRAIANGSDNNLVKTRRLRSHILMPRRVTVVNSDEVSLPMCWGVVHPVVILPSVSQEWPPDRVDAVMHHELAHAIRCDYLAHLIGEMVRAIYWLNPLVWIAVGRAAMEREHACDDEALNVGVRSDAYARHLLDVVLAQSASRTTRGAIAMAGQSDLAIRIRKILARETSRRPMSRRGLVATVLFAVLVTLPIATLDLSATAEPEAYLTRSEGKRSQRQRSITERIAELGSEDAQLRRYAAWALGELEDERGVSPLHERLGDSNADVRLVAAWALGEIKLRRSVDPLVETLDDEDPLVREMAALALGEIGHPRAVEPLVRIFERDEDLGGPIIWALGEIDAFSAYEARMGIFETIGRRPWENTEVWAGEWRGWAGPERLRELATLERAVQSDDPETRQLAVWEMGHLNDERTVETLLDLLRDEDLAVRAMAVWALDETNPSRKRRRVTE